MRKIIRGTDVMKQINLKDDGGIPINLTDCVVYFTVKRGKDLGKSDDNAVISKEFRDFLNPTNGIMEIKLNRQETNLPSGGYYYDIQIVDIEDKVHSIPKQKLYIISNVTKKIVDIEP